MPKSQRASKLVIRCRSNNFINASTRCTLLSTNHRDPGVVVVSSTQCNITWIIDEFTKITVLTNFAFAWAVFKIVRVYIFIFYTSHSSQVDIQFYWVEVINFLFDWTVAFSTVLIFFNWNNINVSKLMVFLLFSSFYEYKYQD